MPRSSPSWVPRSQNSTITASSAWWRAIVSLRWSGNAVRADVVTPDRDPREGLLRRLEKAFDHGRGKRPLRVVASDHVAGVELLVPDREVGGDRHPVGTRPDLGPRHLAGERREGEGGVRGRVVRHLRLPPDPDERDPHA